MNFQIYQLEKSQTLDLLDRVIRRLENEANDLRNDDEGRDDALDTLCNIQHNVEGLRTPLDIRESELTVGDLARLFRNYDDYHRGTAVEFFATHFSNYNTDYSEFMLAAGYALRPVDQLLREEEEWREAR